MNTEIKRFFFKIVNNSLTTQQINFLGEKMDPSFDLHKVSGFSSAIPIPRQTAAQTLLQYFEEDEEIVRIFSYMLQHEGERLYNRDLYIWGRDQFITILRKYKWIFDEEINMFFLDPFYEHEINYLKKIRIIDFREDIPIQDMVKDVTEISKQLSIADLEWRVVMRLYDLDRQIGELIRNIITLLLTRQELQMFTGDLFVCLKELTINASKANYKLLYEKHITAPQGITTESNYFEFLERFRNEIDENGNKNLFELARKEDRYITITFQSTIDSIEMWVTNNQNITAIEKQQIIKKLYPPKKQRDSFFDVDDDGLNEGAGMGINIILRVLRAYSKDPHPLKVVFYPDFLKMGFQLKRKELKEQKDQREEFSNQ